MNGSAKNCWFHNTKTIRERSTSISWAINNSEKQETEEITGNSVSGAIKERDVKFQRGLRY